MKTVQISLNSIDKVKSFVNDLSKPIDLNIHADGDVDAILAALDPYIIK